jgi:hypothetical protein
MVRNAKAEIAITDLRKIIKELRKIDPTYVGDFYKQAKDIAKPVQAEIIKGIPASAPVSGMRPKSQRARLGWGIGKRAKSVVVKTQRTVKRSSSFAKGKSNQYSVAYVAAQSPGTVLADMAGRSRKWVNKYPLSREHDINLFGRGTIVKRRYRMNNQGVALINALSASKGGASRFVWPSALKALPQAKKEVARLIGKANDVINSRLRRASGR